ncbi:putative site-specific integrase-resolvase [Metallosphaera yellowstonensis MK1]|uniref:Putative site-specific integrase-resolvase n=1 Tax=Metallosphaera yellowstonensis MK1 TaxID=671065 RepID=H2C1F4_9CREN|nr:putative site-specific integrase-resolvase [Metallosphaera yellowstonensis MK1]
MVLKPKEVCQKLGISYRTLQSYVKEGYIKPVVQSGKWRFREDLEKLMGIVKRRKVALYARVSNERKDDLVNQVKYLEENVKEYEGDNRRGVLVEREEEGVPQLRTTLNNEVSKAIAYPDRPVRFGFEIVEEVCKAHDHELVVLNGEDKTPEQELVEDLISIRIVKREIARSGESRVREGEEVRRGN